MTRSKSGFTLTVMIRNTARPLLRALHFFLAGLIALAVPTLAQAQSITAAGNVVANGTPVTGTVPSPWHVAGNLFVGNAAAGTLDIDIGAEVAMEDTSVFSIGDTTGSSGEVTVENSGRLWAPGGAGITVGSFGSGTLRLVNNGWVDAQKLTIAQASGTTGMVIIGEEAGSLPGAPGGFYSTSPGTTAVSFGSGNGYIIFNHTGGDLDIPGYGYTPKSHYFFAPYITSAAGGSGTVAFENGITILGGVDTYSGTTLINPNATVIAGSTGALSSNANTTISGGTIYLAGYSNTVASLNATANSGTLEFNGGETLTVTGAASGTTNIAFAGPTTCTTAGTLLVATGSTTATAFQLAATGSNAVAPAGTTCQVVQGAGGAQPATSWYLKAIAVPVTNQTITLTESFSPATPGGTLPTASVSCSGGVTAGGAFPSFTAPEGAACSVQLANDGAAPAGYTMGTATFGGTGVNASTGAFTVPTGSGIAVSVSVPLTATTSAPAFTTAAALPGGTVGAAYTGSISATGSPAPTFALTTGALPPGLSLGSGGAFSGQPGATGDYTFTVTATNSQGSASRTFTLHVDAAPAAPAISTAAALPNATVGVAYSAAIAATGNPAPASFTVTAGALPAWLALDATTGALTGTPPTGSEGNEAFTVTVSNGVGTAAAKAFTLKVLPPGSVAAGNAVGIPALSDMALALLAALLAVGAALGLSAPSARQRQ